MMKAEEIRGLGIEEMEEKVGSMKKELLILRTELKLGKLEKHHRIAEMKKNIARLFTIIREEKSKENKTGVKKKKD